MRTTAARVRSLALAVAAALAFGACSSTTETSAPASPARATTTSTSSTTTTTSTTTTVPPTTTAPRIAAPPPGLGRGASGPAVQALEQRLLELHFDSGKTDGVYDGTTQHAVMAFQKVYGLARTGRATNDVLDRLTNAEPPAPLLPSGGATRVEIDLPRQVLFLYEGGSLFRILSVSTGSGRRYCVDGGCARAVTPGGSFRVSRRLTGWRVSRLGKLYNPLYFNGGIAIHGAPSVPGYPASHGCVRIPMTSSLWFPSHVATGTPVYVVGGPRAAVPFNEPAPGEQPPPPPTTVPGPAPTPVPPTTVPPTTVPAPTTSTTAAPSSSTSTTVPDTTTSVVTTTGP